MDELVNRDPVFVVSTPRAGSTLLGAMLGSHSQMLCPPEPWLMLPLAAMRSASIPTTAVFGHALACEAIGQLADEALLDRGYRAMIQTIYGELLARSGKRIFVDKTPRYYQILPQLKAIFPDTRIIWINRNPLDVLTSLRDTWNISMEELLGIKVGPYTFDCTLSLRMLANFFDVEDANRIIVRYEELVHQPQEALQRLCAFVGVDFELAMLDYGSNDRLVQQYATRRMGDKKVLEHGRPHEQSLDRWKKKLSPGELYNIIRTLGPAIFERLGYAESFAAACGLAQVDASTIAAEGELPRIEALYHGYQGSHEIAVRCAQLQAELAVCEADRAERLKIIHKLVREVAEINADRAKRLKLIEKLNGQVTQMKASRSGPRATINKLTQEITEINLDRAKRLEIIEQLAGQVDVIKTQAEERLRIIEQQAAQLEQAHAIINSLPQHTPHHTESVQDPPSNTTL